MRIVVSRVVRDRETKENIEFSTSVESEDVQCVYQDQNGVSLSLSNGCTFKVGQSLKNMIDCFIKNDFKVTERV